MNTGNQGFMTEVDRCVLSFLLLPLFPCRVDALLFIVSVFIKSGKGNGAGGVYCE